MVKWGGEQSLRSSWHPVSVQRWKELCWEYWRCIFQGQAPTVTQAWHGKRNWYCLVQQKAKTREFENTLWQCCDYPETYGIVVGWYWPNTWIPCKKGWPETVSLGYLPYCTVPSTVTSTTGTWNHCKKGWPETLSEAKTAEASYTNEKDMKNAEVRRYEWFHTFASYSRAINIHFTSH